VTKNVTLVSIVHNIIYNTSIITNSVYDKEVTILVKSKIPFQLILINCNSFIARSYFLSLIISAVLLHFENSNMYC